VTARSRVWLVLERYYDLSTDAPISSPLGSIDTGGADNPTNDIKRPLAFMCDIGMALAGLTPAQREQVELYYHTHRAWENADAMRRNASLDVYRAGGGQAALLAQRSKREWRRIADRHQQRLNAIRRRRAYLDAMDRLELSLPIVMILGGWCPCGGVTDSCTGS
jgi:hypothetical protein